MQITAVIQFVLGACSMISFVKKETLPERKE
jgi:hypothetical protein